MYQFETKDVTPYEEGQIQKIEQWINKKEPKILKVINKAFEPLSNLVNLVVPASAIEGALVQVNKAAEFLTDKDDILRDGKVKTIHELQTKSLELSDSLANEVHNWAIGASSVEGAATGALGWAGLAVDIPSLILISVRTIHKIGVCYGFECKTKEDELFVLEILRLSNVLSQKEKIVSVTTLQAIGRMAAKNSWKKIAQIATEEVAKKEFTEEFEKFIAKRLTSLHKNMPKLIGKKITKDAVKKGVPAVGAIIGAAINTKYINDIAWAARYMYQQRWLQINNKIIIADAQKG